MTVRQLIAKAAECQTCGKAHKPKVRTRGYAPNWAAPDGHPYRPRVPRAELDKLRELAS